MPPTYYATVYCRGALVYGDVDAGRETLRCCACLAAEAASAAGYALAELFVETADRPVQVGAWLYQDGALVAPQGELTWKR